MNHAVTKIPWSESVWFSDIDDTLIDTQAASVPGSEGVRLALAGHYGDKKAGDIQAGLNAAFELMVAGYRVRHQSDWQNVPGGEPAFDELMDYVTSVQTQVQAGYGHIKKWSREIFIKLAADKAGVEITPELVHEATDAYWMTLTKHVKIFPDAMRLAATIASHGRPLYLVTSSDGRLKMQADGQFVYEPAYSEALKRQRIELLRARGLRFNTISIGDPEDKPHPDFFTKAVRLAETDLGHSVDCSKAVMMGDSFGGDLQVPKEQLGFGLVVLREYGRNQLDVIDAHQITVGDVHEAAQFLN